MRGFHEYLELHEYFGRSGEPRLSMSEFTVADAEWKALAEKHPNLDRAERARLSELKELLHRDRP